MVDFSRYQVPDVYVQEDTAPLVAVTPGVSPSVVCLVGPASGYQSATEQVTLTGTTPVVLARTGILPSSLIVTQVDGSTVAGPQTVDGSNNILTPGSYALTVIAAQDGIQDTQNNQLEIQRVVQPTPVLGVPSLNSSGSVLATGNYYYVATALDAFGETVVSNEVTASVTQILAPALQALTTASTGGSFAAGAYYYVVTALNAQGETIASNEQGITLSTVSSPVLGTPTTTSTGGTFSSGTYYYKVTATNAVGETVGSNEQNVTLAALTAPTLNGITPSTGGGALVGTIAAPVQSSITGSTSGGSIAAGTYYYKVTATTANGETLASNEQSVTNTGSSSSNTIGWAAVTGATGYKIYRGTAAGSENYLVTTIGSGSTTTYVNTSLTGGSSVSPPIANTATTTYYYKVTATNALGETIGSNEQIVTNTGTTSSNILSWTQIAGATGYKLYRGTTAGGENALVSTIGSGLTTNITDIGATTTNVSPPGSNTTLTATNAITLPWSVVPNATGYKVYRGTASGSENLLIGTIGSGTTVTFTDTNISGSSATPPVTNTTVSSTNTITVPWVAVSGATGYKIYRGVAAGNETVLVASVGQVASYTDTGGAGTLTGPPTANTTARSVVLTITTPSQSATGYKIYRGTASNQENVLIASLPTPGTLTYTDNGSSLSSSTPPSSDTSSVIATGGTVFVSYNYQTVGYDSPQTFTDYDSLSAFYGQPVDLTSGALLSPLSLAAQVAFTNGATSVIGVAILGQVTTTALASAYAKVFTNFSANLIVPLTDGFSTGSISQIASDLRSHCYTASADGYNRIGLLGVDTGVTTAPDVIAVNIADKRVIEVFPNKVNYYVGGNANTMLTLGGQYLAAACAGILAANPVQQGLTRQVVRGLAGIPDPTMAALTRSLQDQYSAAGVTVATRDRAGRIVIRHGVTTDNTSINTSEISVVRAKDALVDLIQSGVENSGLIGSPITADTPLSVKGIIAGFLETAKTTGVIIDYENLLVRQQTGNPTVIEVKFGYQPSYPLNYIVITFSIDVITGDTTTTDTSNSTTNADTSA